MQVQLARSFQKSLEKLTSQEQSAVKQIPTDFMLSPKSPGHRLHKINTGKDRRFASISVSMDLRIIVLKDEERILFLYVDHHDKAYQWAERRRCEVHPVTGSAQIVEIEEVIREEVRVIKRTAVAPLFTNEDDDYLLSLGVPETWLSIIKQCDEDSLMDMLDRLPEEAAENLVELASGSRPIPWTPDPTIPIPASPFDHPDAKRRFWIATDEDALKQALDFPWEQWAVFLHPSQSNAVERNFKGPARVTGGAGTGKTVVALHRAARLAKVSTGGRILLTTYSPNLAGLLSDALDTLLGTNSDARAKVDVIYLHEVAARILSGEDEAAPIFVEPDELFNLLQDHRGELDEDISTEFLAREWERIIDFWGLMDWLSYRDVQRTGLGVQLPPAKRKKIWPVFEAVREDLASSGRHTASSLCTAAMSKLTDAGQHPYRHVVVDEAQDLGPCELRFASCLAPPGPQSLLFSGDSGQRINRCAFSWLRAGVDIRGRGVLLRVNYRTTEEIKNFADTILPTEVSGFDDQAEARRSISLLNGPVPKIVAYKDVASETKGIEDWLEELVEYSVEPDQIGVLVRNADMLAERVLPALKKQGLKWETLSPYSDFAIGKVSVGTLRHAKGMEFRAVAIIGCEDTVIPDPKILAPSIDPALAGELMEQEKHLVYVGATRAREFLFISHVGPLSRFLV